MMRWLYWVCCKGGLIQGLQFPKGLSSTTLSSCFVIIPVFIRSITKFFYNLIQSISAIYAGLKFTIRAIHIYFGRNCALSEAISSLGCRCNSSSDLCQLTEPQLLNINRSSKEKNELTVLSFPQNLSKLVFPSSMVINLWECRRDFSIMAVLENSTICH